MAPFNWLFGRTPKPIQQNQPAPLEEFRPSPIIRAPARPALSHAVRVPEGSFRFVALDVETACSDAASICQIGLACVQCRRDGPEVEFNEQKEIGLTLGAEINGPATDLGWPLPKLPSLNFDGLRLTVDDHNQIMPRGPFRTDVSSKAKRVQLGQGQQLTKTSGLLMG